MAITVLWDSEEKKIIRWDFDRTWQWDDFQGAVDKSVIMADEVGFSIDIIVNLTASPFFPPGSIVSNVRRGMVAATDHGGKVVLTGGTLFANAMAKVFRSIYKDVGQSLLIAPDLAEARRMIQRIRSEDQI